MGYIDAPPPEDRSPGFKRDPLGSRKQRKWDGQQWTGVVRTKGFGRNLAEALPTWAWVVVAVVVGLIVLGAAVRGEDEGEDETVAATTSAAKSLAGLKPPARWRAIAEEQFGGKLRNVKVIDGFAVQVTFVEDEEFFEFEMEQEMVDAYAAYFDAADPPGVVQLKGQVWLVNEFNEESIGLGWVTRMNRATGERVPWDEIENLNLEEIWTRLYKRDDL